MGKIIKKNNGKTDCLQINLDVELEGDYFNLRQDWNTQYSEYTILDVNVTPKTLWDMDGGFEKPAINEDLIEEYFTKTGMGKRENLKKTCLELYREHSG